MKKILFDLQLFADDAGSGADNADNAGGAASADNANKGAEQNTDNKQQPDTKPGAEEKKYTDSDVDKLIDKKFAEWQKKKDQEIAEAEKLAKMNAEEKANFNAQKEKERADKAEARIAELERKDTLSEMSKTARKMLSDKGISISDELIARLVTTDAAETKSAVDSFATLFNEAVENGVKAKLRGEPPKGGAGRESALSEIDRRIAKYN